MTGRWSALVVFLCAVAAPALAVPVTWTLNGVAFSDGGSATGSFIYDADTNTFSSINVQVSGGSLPALTYIAPHPVAQASIVALLPTASGDFTGVRVVVFGPIGGLTNAGGTLTLNTAPVEGTCTNPTCSTTTGGVRSLTAGTLVGVAAGPAPIPAVSTTLLGLTGALLAGGAMLLMRRRGSDASAA